MKRGLIATLLISLVLLSTVSGTALAVNNTEFHYENVVSQIPPPLADYGDAPSPYPTQYASGGAHHLEIGLLMYLGSERDNEPDGQPDPNALGDDNNGLDDEDGVVFGSPIQPGSMATANVTITSPILGFGFLNAWVDFNGDGDWDDAGEQIFADLFVTDFTVNELQFSVPSNALGGLGGTTFARFRLSLNSPIPYWGEAADGEVEDYMIEIEPLLGSISGMKWEDLDGNGIKDAGEPGIPGWTIELYADGNLIASTTTDANGIYGFWSLPAGDYTVAEVPLASWTQTYPKPIQPGTHTVNVAAGQNVGDVDFGNKSGEEPPPPPIEVGGDVFPTNKIALLAPWIALAAVIVASATIAIRRRLVKS